MESCVTIVETEISRIREITQRLKDCISCMRNSTLTDEDLFLNMNDIRDTIIKLEVVDMELTSLAQSYYDPL